MSAVHVAFQINPATELIVLSVRSKQISSVKFAVLKRDQDNGQNTQEASGKGSPVQEEDPGSGDTGEQLTGDGVILYSQDYSISIASYDFQLLWLSDDAVALKIRAVEGYRASSQQLQDVRSRDRPTEYDNSEALSWHITRLDTVKGTGFKDIPHLRDEIGKGSYGKVYKAIDQASGHIFAIKVVKLEEYGDIDAARALLHREIKMMERLHHVSNMFPDLTPGVTDTAPRHILSNI